MSTIYEQNLNYLKEKLPNLYKVYSEEIGKNQTGKQIKYCVTNENDNLRLNGKLVHSKYDPHIEGKLMSMSLEDNDFDTLFVMGIGMGYHLPEIIESFPDKNKIFYEPNVYAFDEFLKRKDIEKFDKKNVLILIGDTKENISQYLISLFSTFKIYRISFIGLPTNIAEYIENWHYITKEFVKFFSMYTVNVKTLKVYNNQWILNYFKNLKHFPYESEFDDYKNEFKGIPGVIISSGPSLAKNVHLLNEIKDKALIICAGSSVNAVEARGIIPHAMLGVDGSQLMSDEFNAVMDTSILFIHIMNVHYDCIDKYKGPKMHIKANSEPHIQYFEKINNINSETLKSGGSCANVAMDCLVKLGCNPIILIGQDLAYTDNVSHSEGVWDKRELTSEDLKNIERGYTVVKDIYGNNVYTDRSFDSMHKWFEDYIAEKKEEGLDINIVNATEGGRPIKGADHTTFRHAIDTYCKKNVEVSKRLNDIFNESLNKTEEKKKYILKFLDVLEEDMEELKKLSKERLKKLNNVMKKIEKGNIPSTQLRDQVNKVTDRMESKEAYSYMIWFPSFELIYNIKNAYEVKANEKDNIIDKFKILYEGLKKQFEEVDFRIDLIKKLTVETKTEIGGWKNGTEDDV